VAAPVLLTGPAPEMAGLETCMAIDRDESESIRGD
jgi:hypothetical protein